MLFPTASWAARVKENTSGEGMDRVTGHAHLPRHIFEDNSDAGGLCMGPVYAVGDALHALLRAALNATAAPRVPPLPNLRML
jgi:hypothetical protein